jgi:serine/threonine protein kinase/Tfp pilus assembly protein PilF
MALDQERVLYLFEQASALPRDRRAAFLDGACAGEATLREEVESLLAAQESAGDFLGAITIDDARTKTIAPPSTVAIGTRIGRYRLVSLLGEGGFGIVYHARQEGPVRRDVALKLVKPGMDSRQVLARFAAERQALAILDHPHIARVYDAGTTDIGRPYFVMEYVPGKPITQFCDDNRLSISERLLLFVQACDAIGHAHTKAIIHRDVKASNVLAYMHDGKPTVKVIDFGIAKALRGDRLTDASFNTEGGLVIGTYDSMSPEQAEGSPDIDTRTDVYSLGVLLYELLSGAKPFDHDVLARGADDEIRRLIREVDPPPPSTRLGALGADGTRLARLRQSELQTLTRQLRGELEWIPLKAMRKERARRYASPQQLADDIQNYLDGKPLLAGPESRAYRLRKLATRHRSVVVAISTIAVVIVGGIATTSWQAWRATLAEHRATANGIEATKQAQAAKQQAAIADAVNGFQADMLASADPNQLMGDKVTVLDAISGAQKALDAGKLTGQPLVEAAVRTTIGRTLRSLGRLDLAAPNLQRALELRRRELPDRDPEIAESLCMLGELLHDQGKLSEAEPLLRDALRYRRDVLPAGHTAIADSLNSLAGLLQGQGRLAEAEPLFVEALEVRRKSLPAAHPDVAQSLNNLGLLRCDQGNFADAEPLLRGAIVIWRESLSPNHPVIANALNNLGTALQEQGRFSDAEPLLREALDVRRRALPSVHPAIANSLTNLASLLQDQGKLSEAEPLYREALDIARRALPPGHRDVGTSMNNLARLLQERGQLVEAELLFRGSIDVYRRALPGGHPDLATSINNLAKVLEDEGAFDEAEALHREALSMRRQAFRSGHPDIAQSLSNLGALLNARGRVAEAEPLLREALQFRRDNFGPRAAPTTRTATALATLLDRTNRSPEAAALRDECGLSPVTSRPASPDRRR